MQDYSAFYLPVDPFAIHKNIMEWKTPLGQKGWLRYLSLITDLETLNTWRPDPEARSNMRRDPNAVYLIKVYRELMMSETTQVFMLGMGDMPVCVIKAVQAQASPWMLRLRWLAVDGLLEFVFRGNPRSALTLTGALERFTEYYFSFPGGRTLSVPIPENDLQNIRSVEEAGFLLTNQASLEEQPYGIYRYPRQ